MPNHHLQHAGEHRTRTGCGEATDYLLDGCSARPNRVDRLTQRSSTVEPQKEPPWSGFPVMGKCVVTEGIPAIGYRKGMGRQLTAFASSFSQNPPLWTRALSH